MLAAGELPVVRIGRSVRIPRDELRDWIRLRAQEEARLHSEHWREVFAARKEAVRRSRADLGFDDHQ